MRLSCGRCVGWLFLAGWLWWAEGATTSQNKSKGGFWPEVRDLWGQRFSARCQVSTVSWVVRSLQNSVFKDRLSLGVAIGQFRCFRLSVPSAAIASRSWLRFRDTQCSKAHIVACISLSLQCFSFQVIDRCFREYLRPSVVQVVCCAYSGEFVESG